MLCFVFPGQGSQRVGMGADLCGRWAVARHTFAEADEALGLALSRLCFEGPEETLRLTVNAQPALLSTCVAIARVLEAEVGLTPDVVAGHSLGEYSALACAGALRFDDAVRLVRLRGELMQAAVPVGEGAMAAVMRLANDDVAALCRDAAQGRVLVPANWNGGGQVVVSGHADAVARAVELAGARGGTAVPLDVSAPFHSPLMAPAAAGLAAALATVSIAPPRVPVVANVDAEPNLSAARVADLLVRQVTGSVLWEASVRRLAAMGVTTVVEVGPGKVLTGLVRRIEKSFARESVGTADEVDALRVKFDARRA
jgi:[acyl-carrier-protein] S-malonyltransferase